MVRNLNGKLSHVIYLRNTGHYGRQVEWMLKSWTKNAQITSKLDYTVQYLNGSTLKIGTPKVSKNPNMQI